jgi:hypothetical protein
MKINPAASIYRPQPVKRDMPPGIRELTLDVPESEIREQEKEDAFSRQISIASQALFCFAIILLLLNVVNQVVKLCF